MTRYGLSNDAAQARLRRYGPNALPGRPPTPLWRRFARQFQSPLIYILLFALVADAAIWVSEGATGAPAESIAIAVILLLNAGLGVYQESKSEAALARLKEMAAPMVWVIREGRLVHLGKKSASISRRLTAPLLVGSVVLSGLIACGRHPESESNHPNGRGRLVIQNIGSDTMVNLAQAWAEEYAVVEPAVSVEVSGGGTGTGVAALINGAADIANCSRRMEAGEIAKVSAADGQKPKENIVGYDALAIFAHKGNPLEEVTIGQLAAIYGEKGQIRSWADLGVQVPGCRSGEMILVSRQSNSGTYYYFREAVLGKGVDFRLGTLDLHGSKDVVELVSRTHCAIGYSGMGYGTPNVKMLRVARKPDETAFAPNVENTQNGKYPIARPLYMYTRGEPKDAVKKYVEIV